MSSFTQPIVFLSIFLILLPTISSDFLAPLLSPFIDELCKDIACGKGKCKASTSHTLGYMCECDQGWKQTTSEESQNLGFLPCVIPNCTLDYSCAKAETPSPQVKDPPKNSSFFDPCNWAYCGEGSCIKSGTFGHNCTCYDGYANLMNATTFPCFRECSIGADCANLGFTRSTNSAPPTADKIDNHGTIVLPGKSLWMVLAMGTLVASSWH